MERNNANETGRLAHLFNTPQERRRVLAFCYRVSLIVLLLFISYQLHTIVSDRVRVHVAGGSVDVYRVYWIDDSVDVDRVRDTVDVRDVR